MKIVKDYRDTKELRDSFNELAKKVFNLSFEEWYQNGFWKENYNPVSIVIEGKEVSNVSVNKSNMNYNWNILKLLQLWTVMTAPEYRGNGYVRILMDEIMKEYEGKVDGIYLYANDSVLDFYPKFGFVTKPEFQYSKDVINTATDVTYNIPMETS